MDASPKGLVLQRKRQVDHKMAVIKGQLAPVPSINK
jgi:hypothetical protein